MTDKEVHKLYVEGDDESISQMIELAKTLMSKTGKGINMIDLSPRIEVADNE